MRISDAIEMRSVESLGVSGFGLGVSDDAALSTRVQRLRQRDEHKELFSRLSHCHVLIFDAETEQEGIYCVEQEGLNIVLGFESQNDAMQYATKLRRQGFYNPTAREASLDEMIAFCWESNGAVKLKLVAEGTHLVPPALNQPDLERPGVALESVEVEAARKNLQRLFEK